jgi:hypothetical protein
MKTSKNRVCGFPTTLALAAAMLLPAMAPAQTNWTAFNDHTGSAVTAPNATIYGMIGRSIATAPVFTGPLKDLATGTELPVIFTSTAVGSPDDFGTMAYPNAGTPAYELFNGIIDLGNVNSGIGCRSSSGSSATLVFTGLDPTKRYIFRGTSVRGGNYLNRWTVCSIQGAAAATDAHTAGVFTTATFPTGGMTNGQAAFDSGENRSDGALVGWDNIDPGPDGSFSVLSEQYVANPMPNGQAPNLSAYGYGLCGMMLVELGEPTPITIVTQPPAETTVTQYRNFTLSVTAQGTLPQYQWYKEGVGAIAGATRSTYTLTNALLADAGNYYVTIGNNLGSVTSANAHVTVVEDLVKPTLVRASGSATFTNIVVEFSEELDPASAVADFTYTLVGDPSFVLSATLLPGGKSVQLLMAPDLAPDTLFTVNVTGVKDFSGNEILPDSQISFRSWISSGCNGLQFDVFTGLSTTDNGMGQLTNNVNYPNNPAERYSLTTFDTREVFPTDAKEGYGGRMRGLFIAPYSGLWRFFIRSDDGSILYANTNGPSAAGKTQVAIETGCCNAFQPPGAAQTSTPFTMTAGTAYYIEAIYKEGTGGDFCQVAARAEGDPTAPASLLPIPGAWLGVPAVPANVVGPVTLLQQPASTSVSENTPSVLFSAQGTNALDARICYQWQRDDGTGFADILGGVGPTYSIAFPTIANDNGDKYRCIVQVPGSSSITSTEATLTVTADTTQPTVVAVHATFTMTNVVVSFSERLDPTVDLDFYFTSPTFTVISADVDATGTNVIVLLQSPLVPGSEHAMNITDVTDFSGLTMAETNVTVRAWVVSRGFALQQVYLNVTGVTVPDLTGNPKYPNSPDVVAWAPTLEGPIDRYDNYGTGLSGWIAPPIAGNYLFYVCSDDASQFSLSSNEDPFGLALIAQEMSYNATRIWTGDRAGGTRGTPPSNISTNPIPMTVGQLYAFAMLAKEGGGGDNSGVNWQLPGGSVPANGTLGIAGAHLYSLADPVGASVTVTQQPVSVEAVLPATVSFSIGASSTLAGAANTNITYIWQRNDGTGFADILGAYSRTYSVALSQAEASAQFRALVFSPGASATSQAAGVLASLRVSITRNGNAIRISWPLPSTGVTLETTPTLAGSPPPWTTVPANTYQTDATSVYVVIPAPVGNAFYRLRQ